MSVEFKWKKYCYIDQFEMVNTFYLGNILRVRQIKNGLSECPIIRLPNNEYKIKTTGEIKKNKKTIKNRSQGESAMKRTRREIRDIITKEDKLGILEVFSEDLTKDVFNITRYSPFTHIINDISLCVFSGIIK